MLRPWLLPAAHRAISPASSASASVDGDPAQSTESTGAGMAAKPPQPSPGPRRADSAHGSLSSPAQSADAGGDFARLLSLDLSPPDRISASPLRRRSGVSHLTLPLDEPGSPGDGLDGSAAAELQSSRRGVTVALTVHPDDTMGWVTVELIAGVEAGQDHRPMLSGCSDERSSAAQAPESDVATGRSGLSTPAAALSSEGEDGLDDAAGFDAGAHDSVSATDQAAPAATDPPAPEFGVPVPQALEDGPPVDDWVTGLPAVPKLPIELTTARAGHQAANPAAAAESPSYADLTAQLAGSSDTSSTSEGSPDEGSQSAASEDEDVEERARDPRRELELDVAVAEALAQVSVSGQPSCPRVPALPRLLYRCHARLLTTELRKACPTCFIFVCSNIVSGLACCSHPLDDLNHRALCRRRQSMRQMGPAREATTPTSATSAAQRRAGQQGIRQAADPRTELDTDLAVEALLAAAAEMGAGGPGGAGNHDVTLLQVKSLTS